MSLRCGFQFFPDILAGSVRALPKDGSQLQAEYRGTVLSHNLALVGCYEASKRALSYLRIVGNLSDNLHIPAGTAQSLHWVEQCALTLPGLKQRAERERDFTLHTQTTANVVPVWHAVDPELVGHLIPYSPSLISPPTALARTFSGSGGGAATANALTPVMAWPTMSMLISLVPS